MMLDSTKRTPRERRFDLFLDIGRLRDDPNAMPRLVEALRKLLPLKDCDDAADCRSDVCERAVNDDLGLAMHLAHDPALAAQAVRNEARIGSSALQG